MESEKGILKTIAMFPLTCQANFKQTFESLQKITNHSSEEVFPSLILYINFFSPKAKTTSSELINFFCELEEVFFLSNFAVSIKFFNVHKNGLMEPWLVKKVNYGI